MKRLLALLLAALLAGCGGGEPAPGVLATDTSTAQAGSADTGATVLVLALPGPVLHLDSATTVRVRLDGSVQLQAHYAAHATAALALAKPHPTGATEAATTLGADPGTVPLAYSVVLHLPAGRTELAAQITARASDTDGTPTSALGRATASIDWIVEVQP